MRRLTVALLLSALTLATSACKRSAQHTQPRDLLSVIPMDDPHAGAQLIEGFYPVEGNGWRWTAGKFSVILRPPPGSAPGGPAQAGARLELKLNIPDVVIRELGAVTLSAAVAGSPLAPEHYTAPGNYVYARDVPASALSGDSVPVDFATDKAIPAGKIEKRELALVVTSIGLTSK
jgi:hypothetical protein